MMIQSEIGLSSRAFFQKEKVVISVQQLEDQFLQTHGEHLRHCLFDIPIFQEELLLPEGSNKATLINRMYLIQGFCNGGERKDSMLNLKKTIL